MFPLLAHLSVGVSALSKGYVEIKQRLQSIHFVVAIFDYWRFLPIKTTRLIDLGAGKTCLKIILRENFFKIHAYIAFVVDFMSSAFTC